MGRPGPRLNDVELELYEQSLHALRRVRTELNARLDAEERAIVADMRARGGTWGEVGAIYGVTGQAALKRFTGDEPRR